jgi:hypothetical protein
MTGLFGPSFQLYMLNTHIEIWEEACPSCQEVHKGICLLLVRSALAGKTGLDDPELPANPYG